MLTATLSIDSGLWLLFWADARLGPRIAILAGKASSCHWLLDGIFASSGCRLICRCVEFLLIYLINHSIIELLSVGRSIVGII